MDEHDSREKLEAAAQTAAGYIYGRGFTNGLADAWSDDEVDTAANRIIQLLDRQAAITAKQLIGESDAPKSEETVENDTSKDDIRNFDDSREKLEADVLKEKNSFFHTPYGFLKVRKWLDRQAAITRGECAECAESMGAYADRLCDPLKERIDELIAERAEIAELVGWDESCDEGGFHTLVPMVAAMCDGNEKAAKFAVELEKQREIAAARGKQIEALEHLLAERKVRYLYAKVCEQRKGLEALEGGDLGQAVMERDMWRDRCGKLLDAAHELARLADAYE